MQLSGRELDETIVVQQNVPGCCRFIYVRFGNCSTYSTTPGNQRSSKVGGLRLVRFVSLVSCSKNLKNGQGWIGPEPFIHHCHLWNLHPWRPWWNSKEFKVTFHKIHKKAWEKHIDPSLDHLREKTNKQQTGKQTKQPADHLANQRAKYTRTPTHT